MRSRWPAVIGLAGVAAWLVIAIVTWAGSAPLGHDESQYAIAARDALADEPARWFYLSRGMTAIATPGIWLGASEQVLRIVPLLLGVGFVLATWTLARRVVGATTAAWALIVLAGTRCVIRWSTDLLSDVPAAACLLAALAVIVDEVDRPDGPRWRLVLAAPLLAAAFYVRYGSVIPIAVIVLAAVAITARTLVRRPLPAITTAAVFLVLLVPHFIQAQQTLGSPLGILLASRDVPQHHYAGEGLVTYVTSNPFKLYGTLAPLVILLGLAALRIRDRRRLLVWLVGVGSLVAIGLTTHAQPRYILVSIAILIVLGTDHLLQLLGRVPAKTRRVFGAALAVAALAVWLLLVTKQVRAGDYRRSRMRGTLLAAPAIRNDAAGAPCTVIGYHYTQLEWYSGCVAPLVMSAGSVAAAHAAGKRVYVVRDYTPTWAPAPQPVFADLPGEPQRIVTVPAVVEVVRLRSGSDAN